MVVRTVTKLGFAVEDSRWSTSAAKITSYGTRFAADLVWTHRLFPRRTDTLKDTLIPHFRRVASDTFKLSVDVVARRTCFAGTILLVPLAGSGAADTPAGGVDVGQIMRTFTLSGAWIHHLVEGTVTLLSGRVEHS